MVMVMVFIYRIFYMHIQMREIVRELWNLTQAMFVTDM